VASTDQGNGASQAPPSAGGGGNLLVPSQNKGQWIQHALQWLDSHEIDTIKLHLQVYTYVKTLHDKWEKWSQQSKAGRFAFVRKGVTLTYEVY
jgi:hypothetical protein